MITIFFLNDTNWFMKLHTTRLVKHRDTTFRDTTFRDTTFRDRLEYWNRSKHRSKDRWGKMLKFEKENK